MNIVRGYEYEYIYKREPRGDTFYVWWYRNIDL